MGDIVFNIAKGRVAEFYNRVDSNDPSTSVLTIVLLKSTGLESDAVLKDYDNLSVILAAANDEADFTNYARKELTDSDLAAFAADDTNDRVDLDFADLTWTSAGGASNNTIGKLLVCYDGITGSGADTAILPLTAHDFSVTTDGSDLTAQVATAGFYRAS